MTIDGEEAGRTRARPTLMTPRLLLRPFYPEDAEELQRLANDRDIAAMTRSIEYPYPIEHARSWINRQDEVWQAGEAAIFAISHSGQGELAGAVGLEICQTNHMAELGYWIAKQDWGKGFATEACAAVLKFGFDELGLNRVFANYLTHNRASGRVLQKLGMKHEGTLRRHARKWGVYYDVEVCGILADEFPVSPV